MQFRIWHLVTVVALSFLLSDKAAAQNPVRINWTAVTGAQSGLFMAQQERLFKKNGLEVELLHIPSSSRGIQAILAGEIAFSFMDGVNAAQANLKGANLALVAGATNRQVFSLMAKAEIKRIADLKGKKIGITRVGSSTHTSALYALGSAGLKPSDYQILPLMEVPNIFTALAAGQIDAGVMSPPTNARAKKSGFVELMNVAKEGPEFVSVAVGTSRTYIKANEDTVRRVVRAYAEGVAAMNHDKEKALKVIAKYARIPDTKGIENHYVDSVTYLDRIPRAEPEAVQTILEFMGKKGVALETFQDNSIIDKLTKEGFFDKLYKKS